MRIKVRLRKKLLKAIGERIKFYRLEKGITQEALAVAVGVDRTFISAIELGKNSTSIYTLYIIASKLDITLKALAEFDIETKNKK